MVVIAGLAYLTLGTTKSGPEVVTFPSDCPLQVPIVPLRTHIGSGEMVFQAQPAREFLPDQRISNLSYELAVYPPGTDHLGLGEIFRNGPLSSLNTTGDFQYHDMEAEGYFSPDNDFFILKNPPNMTVQLRIQDADGKAIAWNMIVGCI